jgi:hypothetical protein
MEHKMNFIKILHPTEGFLLIDLEKVERIFYKLDEDEQFFFTFHMESGDTEEFELSGVRGAQLIEQINSLV